MLNRLSINNISQIRKHYQGHVLYRIIKQSFPHGISGKYSMSTEQVFVELIQAIDMLKQSNNEQSWSTFYLDLKQDYSLHCEDLPEDNLDGIASTITLYLAILLVYPHGKYSNIGQQLIGQYTHHNKNKTQRSIIDNIISIAANSKELMDWFYEYTHSEECLSNAIEPLCRSHEQTIYSHRFKYLKPNIDEEKRNEIEADLHYKSTNSAHAAKELVNLLRFEYAEYIDISGVACKDLYTEFHNYYGLKQTYATFNSHCPTSWK